MAGEELQPWAELLSDDSLSFWLGDYKFQTPKCFTSCHGCQSPTWTMNDHQGTKDSPGLLVIRLWTCTIPTSRITEVPVSSRSCRP